MRIYCFPNNLCGVQPALDGPCPPAKAHWPIPPCPCSLVRACLRTRIAEAQESGARPVGTEKGSWQMGTRQMGTRQMGAGKWAQDSTSQIGSSKWALANGQKHMYTGEGTLGDGHLHINYCKAHGACTWRMHMAKAHGKGTWQRHMAIAHNKGTR